MTLKFNRVYVQDASVIVGPYEEKGPFGNTFDGHYDDLMFGEETWEQAEVKMMFDSIQSVLTKTKLKKENVDFALAGDLINQLVISNYTFSKLGIPYMGIYNACATSGEGMIIASSMIESEQVNNCLLSVSSHNMSAEKQYRYPTEYGGPKPKISTFTVTAGASLVLSNKKSKIRIESATIGKVIDMGIKDVFNMGGVMAPAAADTIAQHLSDTKRDASYYDLILTGDLGIYGKKILTEYLGKVYRIDLKNYDDAGSMLYDREHQTVFAGGSGIACGPSILYGYIFSEMRKKKLKHVLYVPTGALMSPTMVNQKLSIPAISHAISLEVIE